ncbi:MAG: cyclic nucleotide-binding domain-containing protein [Gammaproteobacteria bacterium]|nr:cyclic nucleotide-binding domain-containing protein [Gammaproteobacteria bacterium]
MTDTVLAINPAEFAHIPLFGSVSIFDVEDVIHACPLIRVSEGEAVLSAGQANANLYVVLLGALTVRLGAADSPPVATLERGQLFGELSVLDNKPASAYVVAESPCRLLAIDRDSLWELFQRSPYIANNMLSILSKRIRTSNQTIEALQLG